MRTSPSIVPQGADQDTYLVLEDFGRLGCAWRETDADDADRETLIRDLVEGHYSHPVRIVAFNTAEGWARDVTMDVVDELRRRYAEFGEVPGPTLWRPTGAEVAPDNGKYPSSKPAVGRNDARGAHLADPRLPWSLERSPVLKRKKAPHQE